MFIFLKVKKLFTSIGCVVAFMVTALAQAQDSVSEQEKMRVSSAIRSTIEMSVLTHLRDIVLSRLEKMLAASGARWEKRGGYKIVLMSSEVLAEYSLGMEALMFLEFRPRDNMGAIEGLQQLDVATACEIARGVHESQLDQYWRSSEATVEEVTNTAVKLYFRPQRGGTPYSIQTARFVVDRYTGCVTQLQKTFAFLPKVAIGDGLSVSFQARERLRAKAIDAYTRWRPLEQAVIVYSEVSYNIPHFERHDNEMSDQHRQIALDKKVMPVYRLAIHGYRQSRPYSVQVYVDAISQSAIAISEMALDEFVTFGDPIGKSPEYPAHEEFMFDAGKPLTLTEIAVVSEKLSDNSTLLLQTKDGGLVNFRVDNSQKALWIKDASSGEVRCFKPTEDSWKLIQRELKKKHKPFGKAKQAPQWQPLSLTG